MAGSHSRMAPSLCRRAMYSLNCVADRMRHLVVVHDRQFVPFERRVDQQSFKLRLLAVELQDRRDQETEQPLIVVRIHECLASRAASRSVPIAFVVENRLVQILFRGEVAER